MSDPLVSVIVRTRGRPSLAAALASVVAQQRQDVELVLVDAAGDLAPPDPQGLRMRVVCSGRALGRSAAAQAGLDAACTRWALFLDDDDVLLPGHLDKLVAAARGAATVLAHAGVEMRRPGSDEALGSWDERFEPWELVLANRMPIHAALFDVAAARAAGVRFDETLDLFEDWDFWLQMQCLGEFVHAPGVSALYLLHDEAAPARQTRFGDAAYWRIWHKWLPRAPAPWWASAFEAASSASFKERLVRHLREALAQQTALTQQHVQATQELQGQLVRAAEEAHRLQIDIGATEHRLAQREGSLRWTQGVLQQTQEQLDQTHAALASTRQYLADIEAALATVRAELHRSEQAGLIATQQLAAMQLQRRRDAAARQAMTESLSWRVTAPLRRLQGISARAMRYAARRRRELLGPALWPDPWGAWRYRRWIRRVESPAIAERMVAPLPVSGPLMSLVMPVFAPRPQDLDRAVRSVLAQSYPHWTLCMADDVSPDAATWPALRRWAAADPRVRVLRRDTNGGIAACTNSALTLAEGAWVLFMDQDDLLAPHALAEVAQRVAAEPQARWIYSDEDKVDGGGGRYEPHRKPGFSIELLREQNFLGHLCAVRADLLHELQGLREGFDGAQDHDLALRAAETLRPEQFVHLPQILYHWRAARGSTAASAAYKPQARDAACRAVAEHLARCVPGAVVESCSRSAWLQVRYPLPQARPAVAWAGGLLDSRAGEKWQRQSNDAVLLDDDGRCPWLLHLAPGAWPTSAHWLDELLSLLAQPGVGVVGGRIHQSGRVLASARRLDADPASEPLAIRLRTKQVGAFGAGWLTQGVVSVDGRACVFRRELLPIWSQQAAADGATRAEAFCAAARTAGWRVVWAPKAEFELRD